jgi:hypothetical protein
MSTGRLFQRRVVLNKTKESGETSPTTVVAALEPDALMRAAWIRDALF